MTANRYKVLVVEPFHDVGMQLLRARPEIALDVLESTDEAAIAARIKDVDAITLRTAKLPGHLTERAERLKVVARHGVGYDNVDLDALDARGIPLTITADANAISVAEHALGLMLGLAKRSLHHDRATRAGDWRARNRLDRIDLYERRILIMGFGRIGREVAIRCEAFGMRVVVFDPYVDPAAIGRAGFAHTDDFRATLPETDVLTVHMPLSEETRHMISTPELDALPGHALVINVARGGIVDETALIDALERGMIRGAGLDVFEKEPPDPDNPLFALDNVVLSPHGAGLTQESAVRMGISTAKNVLAALEGTLDPAMVVNRRVLAD